MKKFGVFFLQSQTMVGTYYAKSISYKSPFEDRTLFLHFEIVEGNYVDGYKMDGGGNIYYDTSYAPGPDDPFMVIEAETIRKQAEGFSVYQRIFADINFNGGLPGYLDDDQIPLYKSMIYIRVMLKDGAPEYALREYVNEIEANNIFPATQNDNYKQWILDYAIKWGADEMDLLGITLIDKGAYPFGAVGAP